MKKFASYLVSVSLLASLSLPAAAGPVPDHIHRLWNGIKDLKHCHMVLDTESGTDYGGHREAAEKDIDAALNDLSQAVEFFRTNVAHEANPYPAPNLEPGPEPAGAHPDHIRRLQRGLRDLDNTKRVLDGMAGEEFGGHRAAAEQEIGQAQSELNQAIAFFRSHNGH